jgi:cytochrome c
VKLKLYALGALMVSQVVLADSSQDFDRGLKLAEQKGCFDCHALGRTDVGPSFAAIARYYRRHPQARENLPYILRGGSAGHWGERFIMWPRANLSDAEVQELIKWVVSQ